MNFPWLREIVDAGVTEWCVAAGARNSPLLAALSGIPGLQLWRFADERALGFFALGRAMATRAPVGLCVTSGTAVAELLPAVIEAHYQGLPLLVISGDRPRSHRGKGTPQAMEQRDLFGGHAPTLVDWQDDEIFPSIDWQSWAISGRPAHVNACLSEPLFSPKTAHFSSQATPPAFVDQRAFELWRDFTDPAREPGIVLAGGLSPQEAAVIQSVLANVNWPVAAEITANFHGAFGSAGERELRSWKGTRVLRIGSVPGWRWWRDLENKPEIEVLSLSATGHHGLARDSTAAAIPHGFWERLLSGSQPVSPQNLWNATRDPASVFDRHPHSEPALLHAVAALIPAHARVLWGNSMPVREANLMAAPYAFSSFASRGVNGIDGQCSTAFGLSADCPETWAVLGDLTTLCDPGAAWILDQLPRAKLRFVVMNNDGAEIFRHVADLRSFPDSPEARALLDNPHGRSFEKLAAFWGFEYALVRDASQARAALEPAPDHLLIEVRPDPAETVAFWEEWRA